MENDKIKNWIMIGLLVAILVILVAQPMVMTKMDTTAWYSQNQLWTIGEVTKTSDVVDSVVLYNNRTDPTIYGDDLVYIQHVIDTVFPTTSNDEVMLLNLINCTLLNVSDDTDVSYDADIFNNQIIYRQRNTTTSLSKIDMYNITTDNTTILWNGTTHNPMVINDEFVVFWNGSTELWAYNYVENYSYIIDTIVGWTDYGLNADGYYVVWINPDYELWLHDVSTNTSTFLTQTVEGFDPTISGDKVVYCEYDGDADIYTLCYYNITTNRKYNMLPGWYEAWSPDLYGNTLVCLSVDEVSPDWPQVTLVNIDFAVFGEQYTPITNDSFTKYDPVVNDKYVAWSQLEYDMFIRAGTDNYDVIYTTYETFTETPTGQLTTTYNLAWIYVIIILIVAVVGMFIYRLNDRSDWRFTR